MTEYFSWFRDVNCFRFHRHLLRDQNTFNQAFAMRLRKSAELYFSLEHNGFDVRHPISVQAGVKLLPATSRLHLARPIFAGDGCHRLAILHLAGEQYLPPERYRITRRWLYSPLDNTKILIRSLRMDGSRYFAFLSIIYGDREFYDESSLRDYVKQNHPEKLLELEEVIRIHGTELRALGRGEQYAK